MKLFTRFGLILALVFVLAACGGGDEEATPTIVPTVAVATDTPVPAPTDTPAPASVSAPISDTVTISDTATISDSATISATGDITATNVLTATGEISATGAVTESGEISATESISASESISTSEPISASESISSSESISGSAQAKAGSLPVEQRDGMYSAAPAMTLDPAKFYYATIKTAKGDIKVQLFADRTPLTVNSFVFLAREGFYDNTTFHRVLEGFMMQGGDPTGTGGGGPGYEFKNEPVAGLNFDKAGILAMANAGPDTNGSQFFITFDAAEFLNGGYTIFGEVIEGLDVLPQITRRDPETAPDFSGDALNTVLIEESDTSVLPPPPPTPTPTLPPTPFAPSSLDATDRPLATVQPADKSNYFNTAPAQVISGTQPLTATILTSRGAITASLNISGAPIAVNNFVVLADLGFYDNTPINMVEPGQYIIMGSPGNSPDSDAGYKIVPETGLVSELKAGLIAYNPLGQVEAGIESSSSQLIVTLSAPPGVTTDQFSFFGEVVGGLEILSQLGMTDTIQSVTVIR